jgi:Putative prokaryotic signal transducing protein
MPMIRLTEPHSLGELAIVKSLLDSNGIPYVVHHEHVSSLYPGIPFLSSKVMIDPVDLSRAELLLSRLRLEVRDVSGQA